MKDPGNWLDDIVTRKRWILHVAFWLGILLLYGIFFGRRNNNYFQTIFFVGLLMPVVIGATYVFNYYLIPQFLTAGRYRLFLLYACYTILAALFLEMMVALLTFLVMAELQVQNMSPASVDIFFLMASFLLVVFLGVAIKMVSFWRQSKSDYKALMLEKIEMELKFLKTQLNPHFLFNTLNNLYYLTSTKSDKAPQAVLALSEILDYVLHSGERTQVPVEEEWKQAENYIALELLRYEGRVDIEKKLTVQNGSVSICPRMLITLIENAFKHGVMPVAGKSWIKVVMICTNDKISISVANKRSNSVVLDGIGLQNLRSQLELLYPGRHLLEVNPGAEEFLVDLTLHEV